MYNFLSKNGFPIILVILIIIGGTFFWNKNQKLKTKYDLEVNLKNALQDSIKTYRNKNGDLVSEKLTLQADIKDLKDDNLNLTENQKKIIKRVEEEQKQKDIFAAALAQQNVIIDSLIQLSTNIDTINNTVTFEKSNDTIEFNITVYNVKPINLQPKLSINKLEIPNDVFVEFHWKDEKTNPISFSLTNSNPLFKTNDINSYAIPELRKDEINPNGWQKIKKWFNRNGQKIGIFIGGAVVGGLVVNGS